MFKKCHKCNNELPLDSFDTDVRYRLGKASICKECRKKINAEYYKANGKHKSKVNGDLYLNKIKSKGCGACSLDKIVCLDFHHTRDKSFNISERKTLNQQLIEEVEKCILLCANCHRLHHAGQLDISQIPNLTPISLEQFYKSIEPPEQA